MERSDLGALEGRLGVRFRDRALLELALTHGSLLNEGAKDVEESNQRLEFLGDALLGMIIAADLYMRFPDLQEGELTRLRAHLVKGETLARVGRRLDIGSVLRMGAGEEGTGGRDRDSNLAAAVEAVIGAVYVDQGYEAGRLAVLRVLGTEISGVVRRDAPPDPKVALQERAQSDGSSAPTYRVVREQGPDHDRLFTIEVLLNDRVVGLGRGKRKADAEREAARAALGAMGLGPGSGG